MLIVFVLLYYHSELPFHPLTGLPYSYLCFVPFFHMVSYKLDYCSIFYFILILIFLTPFSILCINSWLDSVLGFGSAPITIVSLFCGIFNLKLFFIFLRKNVTMTKKNLDCKVQCCVVHNFKHSHEINFSKYKYVTKFICCVVHNFTIHMLSI